MDLHLDLHGHRVRASLEGALREAVQGGRLAPGTRLPSSRALAADLGIARNTVAEAYSQLIAEGWLTARQGSGTRVARTAAVSAAAASGVSQPSPPPRPAPYDLRPGFPDLSAFPRAGWLSAARKALSAAPSQALGYGDPRGLPELRAALAAYLARARGVRASPERVIVCSGFAQGLAVLCQVLAGLGVARVAVEEYGQPGPVAALAASGLALVTLGVDDEGAVIGTAAGAEAILPPGLAEDHVVARAAARNVAIQGLGDFALGGRAAGGLSRGPGLVIGYATPPEHAYTTALTRLTGALGDAPFRR